MKCREFRKNLVQAPNISSPALARHRLECSDCDRFFLRYRLALEGLAKPAGAGHQPDGSFSARVVGSLPGRRDPMTLAAVRLLPITTALAIALLGWCLLATPTPEELWARAGEDQLLEWVLDGDSDDSWQD